MGSRLGKLCRMGRYSERLLTSGLVAVSKATHESKLSGQFILMMTTVFCSLLSETGAGIISRRTFNNCCLARGGGLSQNGADIHGTLIVRIF